MLSEINQTQEGTYYMVPLVCPLERADLKDRKMLVDGGCGATV